MTDQERTRPFYPKDNAIPLDEIDWKSRYEYYKNKRDWDPVRDFVGIKRLGSSYHFLDPFFKFDGIPHDMKQFDRYFYPLVVGSSCLVFGVMQNYMSRRPLYGSLVSALAWTAVGVGIGFYAYHNQQTRAKERDAVMVHYMLLHEHDFPKIERKKFGEIMKPWIPFRTMDYPYYEPIKPKMGGYGASPNRFTDKDYPIMPVYDTKAE